MDRFDAGRYSCTADNKVGRSATAHIDLQVLCKYLVCCLSGSVVTDGRKTLHTLLVKYYNDLLDRQSSERIRDEVTCFFAGDVF